MPSRQVIDNWVLQHNVLRPSNCLLQYHSTQLLRNPSPIIILCLSNQAPTTSPPPTTNPHKLKIHRHLLVEAGGPLCALVSGPFKESRQEEIVLHESQETFEHVWRFLTRQPVLLDQAPTDLAVVADRWGLNTLFKAVFRHAEERSKWYRSVWPMKCGEIVLRYLPVMKIVEVPDRFKRFLAMKVALELTNVDAYFERANQKLNENDGIAGSNEQISDELEESKQQNMQTADDQEESGVQNSMECASGQVGPEAAAPPGDGNEAAGADTTTTTATGENGNTISGAGQATVQSESASSSFGESAAMLEQEHLPSSAYHESGNNSSAVENEPEESEKNISQAVAEGSCAASNSGDNVQTDNEGGDIFPEIEREEVFGPGPSVDPSSSSRMRETNPGVNGTPEQATTINGAHAEGEAGGDATTSLDPYEREEVFGGDENTSTNVQEVNGAASARGREQEKNGMEADSTQTSNGINGDVIIEPNLTPHLPNGNSFNPDVGFPVEITFNGNQSESVDPESTANATDATGGTGTNEQGAAAVEEVTPSVTNGIPVGPPVDEVSGNDDDTEILNGENEVFEDVEESLTPSASGQDDDEYQDSQYDDEAESEPEPLVAPPPYPIEAKPWHKEFDIWNVFQQQKMMKLFIHYLSNYGSLDYSMFLMHIILKELEPNIADDKEIVDLLWEIDWYWEGPTYEMLTGKMTAGWSPRAWRLLSLGMCGAKKKGIDIRMSWRYDKLFRDIGQRAAQLADKMEDSDANSSNSSDVDHEVGFSQDWDGRAGDGGFEFGMSLSCLNPDLSEITPLFMNINLLRSTEDVMDKRTGRREVSVRIKVIESGCGCTLGDGSKYQGFTASTVSNAEEKVIYLMSFRSGNRFKIMESDEFSAWIKRHTYDCGLTFQVRVHIFPPEEIERKQVPNTKEEMHPCLCGYCEGGFRTDCTDEGSSSNWA